MPRLRSRVRDSSPAPGFRGKGKRDASPFFMRIRNANQKKCVRQMPTFGEFGKIRHFPRWDTVSTELPPRVVGCAGPFKRLIANGLKASRRGDFSGSLQVSYRVPSCRPLVMSLVLYTWGLPWLFSRTRNPPTSAVIIVLTTF